MLEFNDQLKNDAIRAIMALINDPKSDDVYQQATHLLKIISDSGSQVDKDNALAKFIEPYITSSMIYAPSFNKGILFPDKALDPKTVVRLLSRLRYDALKADNSEIVIESLTYFIDVFSLAFNVNSSIFEKCTINYADHSKDFPKAVYYAFEAYSAPIGVLFKSKEEWESYKQLTKELQCARSQYQCQFNGTEKLVTLNVQLIDELADDKYPLRIRILKPWISNENPNQDNLQMVQAARRIVGSTICKTEKSRKSYWYYLGLAMAIGLPLSRGVSSCDFDVSSFKSDKSESSYQTESSYGNSCDYDVSLEMPKTHRHNSRCVNVYSEDNTLSKDIHVKNMCDQVIKSVKIKYVAIPENPMSPGINTLTFYDLLPGESDSRMLGPCRPDEISIIVKEVIVE